MADYIRKATQIPTDKNGPTLEQLEKIESGQESDADFHVSYKIPGTQDEYYFFRVSWSHIHESHTAEYVSHDGNSLLLDVYDWAKVHAFLTEEWYMPKILGVRCDEHDHSEELSIIEQLFTPTLVTKKPAR